MQELSSIEYKSKLAPYIRGLINEYKSNGCSFQQLAKDLKNFDTFILEKELDSGNLDDAVIDAWSERRMTESLSTRKQQAVESQNTCKVHDIPWNKCFLSASWSKNISKDSLYSFKG